MTEDALDALVAELALDGIVVTREEARGVVRKVAELLLLVSEERALQASSVTASSASEVLPPSQGEPVH